MKASGDSAKGAEYESQGQARSEAERVAPGNESKFGPALKGRNTVALFRPFRPLPALLVPTRGDALRFASRLPLAFIFRAFGAVAAGFHVQHVGAVCAYFGLSYSVPLALSPLAFIFRAFGAVLHLLLFTTG